MKDADRSAVEKPCDGGVEDSVAWSLRPQADGNRQAITLVAVDRADCRHPGTKTIPADSATCSF